MSNAKKKKKKKRKKHLQGCSHRQPLKGGQIWGRQPVERNQKDAGYPQMCRLTVSSPTVK